MPQPINYTVPQPQVSDYFTAMRQGKQDRQAQELDVRQSALRKYLPGALQGNPEDRQQALANTEPDQMAQMMAQFSTLDAQGLTKKRDKQARMASLLMAVQNKQISLDQAKQIAIQDGVPAEQVAQVTEEQIPGLIAQNQTMVDQIEQVWKQKSFGLEQSRTNAQNAASYASADASRRSGPGSGFTLPTRVQTAEDEDISAIQTTQTINSQLDGIAGQLDSGELDLGFFNNIGSRAQNFAGASTQGSTNFATMQTTLEKMRNDSLILNKGVQTEGDAVRAWNALIGGINDKNVVKAQIVRIKKLNEIAANQKAQMIQVRRQRNNAATFDFSSISSGGAQAPAPQQSTPPQGGGLRPGAVEDGFQFQGGNPSDPNNWRPVQ